MAAPAGQGPGDSLSATVPNGGPGGAPPGTTAVDAVFAALADPTRRGVLSRLSADGPLTATELAREVPVSRQAVVKHLTQLADAGLVARVRQGREVRYGVEAGTLAGVQGWLAEVGSQWDDRLAALGRHLGPRPPAPT